MLNPIIYEKYKKSKDPDRYLRMHETQLILYDGAERMLQKIGLDKGSINVDEIRRDYENLKKQKIFYNETYNFANKEAKALQQKFQNMEQYLEKNNLSEISFKMNLTVL